MHWFDIGVTIFLLLFGVWGLWRGLIREVMSLGGFIVAFVLAAHGYPYGSELLAGMIATAWVRQALSIALIFIVVMVVATIIGYVLRMLLHVIGLSLLDRLLGGVFGMLKVTLVVSSLLIASGSWAPTFTKRLGTETVLAPIFFHTADVLALVLSQKDYETFKTLSQQVLQPLQQLIPGAQAPPSAPPPPAQHPGQQSGAASQPTQTHHSPAVVSMPQAQEAPASPEGISDADSKALEKLVRERLQQQRR